MLTKVVSSMKNFIINKCMNYIETNTSYSESKKKEIKYGLVTIYLTFSKLIVIFTLSLILGIFKEMIIYSVIYNILRLPSFGLHATKSWICMLSSAILFIGVPYLCIYLSIPFIIKIIVSIIGILLMFKNSPADTYKKPIVCKKRREIYKFLSVLITIAYSFTLITINNHYISNCLFFSIIMQNCMISPLVYKLFKLPYNNYINYLKNHPDFAN